LGFPQTLDGAVIIDGFPGAGLAGTISAACLVGSLKLPLVAEMQSPHFPALATVLNRRAQVPARVYADEKHKLVIFLGDFAPGQAASYELASAMVEWSRLKGCEYIVTSYSIPVGLQEADYGVSAVVNNDFAEGKAAKAGIPLAGMTAVGGTAGRLLLLGREAEIPVVALLIKAHRDMEDYEAGLKLAEAMMKLAPSAQCDLTSLRGEAQRTEDMLRSLQAHTPAPDVYQ
jgi:uncharacterized protein